MNIFLLSKILGTFACGSSKFSCLDTEPKTNCTTALYGGYCPLVKGKIYQEIKMDQVCVDINGKCFVANAYSSSCEKENGITLDFTASSTVECDIGSDLGEKVCSKPTECKVASIVVGERVIYATDFHVQGYNSIYVQNGTHVEKFEKAKFVECPTPGYDFTKECYIHEKNGKYMCTNDCPTGQCGCDAKYVLRGLLEGEFVDRGMHFACVRGGKQGCGIYSLDSKKSTYPYVFGTNTLLNYAPGTRKFSEVLYPPLNSMVVANVNGLATCVSSAVTTPPACKTDYELYCSNIDSKAEVIVVINLNFACKIPCNK